LLQIYCHAKLTLITIAPPITKPCPKFLTTYINSLENHAVMSPQPLQSQSC